MSFFLAKINIDSQKYLIKNTTFNIIKKIYFLIKKLL